ncbi:hypothetical protein FACS189454_09080 [Planctomycetales bacterium]|nr:hypothetical protein FACS189454_09080 [Planctomycetales bacterium]
MTRPLTPEELCSLIDDHFSTLVLFARQWSPNDADDLVQDAFLQLVKRSPSQGKPEQPVAWLFQTVRNAAIDNHRKAERRQKHETAAARSVWFETPPDTAVDSDEMTAMLDSLTSEQREIVVARIWGGLTFDEIAELTKTSRTTVFRYYNEALEMMRRKHRHQK